MDDLIAMTYCVGTLRGIGRCDQFETVIKSNYLRFWHDRQCHGRLVFRFARSESHYIIWPPAKNARSIAKVARACLFSPALTGFEYIKRYGRCSRLFSFSFTLETVAADRSRSERQLADALLFRPVSIGHSINPACLSTTVAQFFARDRRKTRTAARSVTIILRTTVYYCATEFPLRFHGWVIWLLIVRWNLCAWFLTSPQLSVHCSAF